MAQSDKGMPQVATSESVASCQHTWPQWEGTDTCPSRGQRAGWSCSGRVRLGKGQTAGSCSAGRGPAGRRLPAMDQPAMGQPAREPAAHGASRPFANRSWASWPFASRSRTSRPRGFSERGLNSLVLAYPGVITPSRSKVAAKKEK